MLELKNISKTFNAGTVNAKLALNGASEVKAELNILPGSCVNYTVPQRVRPENVEKFVEVCFRVNNIYRDMEIRVMCGDVQLAKFKREHMAPGEMEKIVLPKALLDKANGNDITVAVCKAEA